MEWCYDFTAYWGSPGKGKCRFKLGADFSAVRPAMPMDNHANNTIAPTDFHKHPAVMAWRVLEPNLAVPNDIQVIKYHRKSWVFRVTGIGTEGSAVIAKRCLRLVALKERTIYEEILPHLPVSRLRYFGFLEEPDGKFCWQFLEDAGEGKYLRDNKEHRALAARWLGLMHTSAARLAQAPTLPNRGASWYLKRLRSSRVKILRGLANPALTAEHVEFLKTVVSQWDVLEQRWDELEICCAGIPTTLVHIDFVPKNIRIRKAPGGSDLLPFDWGEAGWGGVAHDIAKVDVGVYWSVVRDHWPSVDLPSIRRLAAVGRVFRMLTAVYWASRQLQGKSVKQQVYLIRRYRTCMFHGIDAIQSVEATSLPRSPNHKIRFPDCHTGKADG
jgi:hypothetical protein